MIRNKNKFDDGAIAQFKCDEATFKNNKLSCLFFGVLYLLIFIAAGSLNTDSSRVFWIIFPFIFIFLPIGLNLVGVFNLFSVKMVMLRTEYEGSVIRIKNSSMAILVLAILNIVLDLIFIIINRNSINLVKEISYCGLLILLIASVIAFGKKYDKMFGGVILNSN